MYKSLEPYAKLVDFLSAALGDNCEIALHDLTSKDQEIVAISNNPISGREVGAKLSNLSLHYLEEKQYLDHDYVMNYKTVGNDGKLMRAATYFIKEDGREMPVGMLCINVNISDLEYLEHSGNKDFKSNGDEDDTAEDRGFIREPGSKFLTDYQSGNADKEGDRCNDEGCGQCHGETIFCNGKSNR